MDRLSRFRRSRKDGGGAPALAPVAVDDKSSGSRTPSPAAQALAPPPSRPLRSPFRTLHHFRSSGKRARESPPASLPLSPSAAVHHLHDDHHRTHASSPLSARRDSAHDDPDRAGHGRPRIPSFLTLSPQEIELKFHELVWLERSRVMQSVSNPSRDFRWARVASLPQIKSLDRYANVQPWENNRVKLRVPAGQLDYINASPITLTTSAPSHAARPPDRYIAMQGPKHSSMDHVWRMVVEQLRSPAVIVMLTETHEANMEKCHPYFPRTVDEPPMEINDHDEFGDGFRASVRCEAVEETAAGDAIELRKLVIRVHSRQKPPPPTADANGNGAAVGAGHPDGLDVVDEDVVMKSPGKRRAHNSNGEREEDDGGDDERIVYHFLFKKWPDFGVPAIDDLEAFFTLMRMSRDRNADADNPRIVHCSAGVGRSGTFIALEHLQRELDAGVLEHYDGQPPSPDEPPCRPSDDDDDNDKAPGMAEVEGEDLIFATVNQLREQRRNMVQADSQYLFIYQVLRKLWQDRYGLVEDEPAAKRLEVDPFVEEDD